MRAGQRAVLCGILPCPLHTGFRCGRFCQFGFSSDFIRISHALAFSGKLNDLHLENARRSTKTLVTRFLRWCGVTESNGLGSAARHCPLPNAACCHTDAVASAVFPAVTASCRLLAVSPRGYTIPSACCDLSMADPFRLVLRQVTGRGGTDQI